MTEEDIPVLLSMGKENLYVWEKTDSENDQAGAEIQAKGKNTRC